MIARTATVISVLLLVIAISKVSSFVPPPSPHRTTTVDPNEIVLTTMRSNMSSEPYINLSEPKEIGFTTMTISMSSEPYLNFSIHDLNENTDCNNKMTFKAENFFSGMASAFMICGIPFIIWKLRNIRNPIAVPNLIDP